MMILNNDRLHARPWSPNPQQLHRRDVIRKIDAPSFPEKKIFTVSPFCPSPTYLSTYLFPYAYIHTYYTYRVIGGCYKRRSLTANSSRRGRKRSTTTSRSSSLPTPPSFMMPSCRRILNWSRSMKGQIIRPILMYVRNVWMYMWICMWRDGSGCVYAHSASE